MTRKKMVRCIEEKIQGLSDAESIKWWSVFRDYVQEFDKNILFHIKYAVKEDAQKSGIFHLRFGERYMLFHGTEGFRIKSGQEKAIERILLDPAEVLATKTHFYHNAIKYMSEREIEDAELVCVQECAQSEFNTVRAKWDKIAVKDPFCLNTNLHAKINSHVNSTVSNR